VTDLFAPLPGVAVLPTVLAVACAYLIGSLSFAVMLSRAFGLADPRHYGSGNPGATNVLRSGHRTAALLTLLGDALKGVVAVLLARHVGGPFGVGGLGVAAAGLAAFVGHLWPVFFGFKGGKGVATFLGVVLALDPALGAGCCIVWLLVAWLWRFSSLASLAAALAAPLIAMARGASGGMLAMLVVISGLLAWRHRANVAKLMAGRETRIGQRAAPTKAGDRGSG